MSRRIWIVCSITLFVFLFLGINQMTLSAETKRCEELHDHLESDMKSVVDMLIEEDDEHITKHVNDLVVSTDSLKKEKDLLEVADCLPEIFGDTELRAKIDGYHSLLIFVTQMADEKEVQFEEITFTTDVKWLLRIEGQLKGSDEKVIIDHSSPYASPFNSFQAENSRYTLEEQNKTEEDPPFILKVTEGLASSAGAFLQNPIEKLMDVVDDFLVDDAHEKQDSLITQSIRDGSVFKFGYSVITHNEDKRDPLTIVEYYPTATTYNILERAAEVHEELPDYWYPKEAIERRDWNEVVAFYKKHEPEMLHLDDDVYMYIVDHDYQPENFEEIIERAKEDGHP